MKATIVLVVIFSAAILLTGCVTMAWVGTIMTTGITRQFPISKT